MKCHPEVINLVRAFAQNIHLKTPELGEDGVYTFLFDKSLSVHIHAPGSGSHVTLSAALAPIVIDDKEPFYRELLLASHSSSRFPLSFAILPEINCVAAFSSVALASLDTTCFELWLLDFVKQVMPVNDKLTARANASPDAESKTFRFAHTLESDTVITSSSAKYTIFYSQLLVALGDRALPAGERENEASLDLGQSGKLHLRLDDAAEKLLLYASIGVFKREQTFESLLHANARGAGKHLRFSIDADSGETVVTKTLFLSTLSPILAANSINQFCELFKLWQESLSDIEMLATTDPSLCHPHHAK
jgi:hypothetical protein